MEMHTQHTKDMSTIIIDKDKLLGFENETFQTMIQESIEEGSKNILIDLSAVKFISSLGIGYLVHAYTTCMNRNIIFSIKNVNRDIMNVLNHLKLTDIFNIVQ
jgi:anti-anti-sigma factor